MGERLSDAANRVRGSITEALGKLIGDKAVENIGKSQKQEAEAGMKTTEIKKLGRRHLHLSPPAECLTNRNGGAFDELRF
jgi:uncharacterized protein YjbJ (UPF0337 family)